MVIEFHQFIDLKKVLGYPFLDTKRKHLKYDIMEIQRKKKKIVLLTSLVNVDNIK